MSEAVRILNGLNKESKNLDSQTGSQLITALTKKMSMDQLRFEISLRRLDGNKTIIKSTMVCLQELYNELYSNQEGVSK